MEKIKMLDYLACYGILEKEAPIVNIYAVFVQALTLSCSFYGKYEYSPRKSGDLDQKIEHGNKLSLWRSQGWRPKKGYS